jgi:WD40 repeat protein
MLAAGRADGRVNVWDAESGAERMAFQPGSRTVTALAFTPSGRSLAVGQLLQPTTVWAVPQDDD